jgi:hypothetical protein
LGKAPPPFPPPLILQKKVSDFPIPSQDVTNQTLPDRELFNTSLIIPGQGMFGSDIPAGDGKIANFWHPGCRGENRKPFFTVYPLQYAVGKMEHVESETRIPVFKRYLRVWLQSLKKGLTGTKSFFKYSI